MKSRSSWAGKHVVITGAASGIGQATALELASRGARVTLADINAAGVEATANRVRSLGGEARAFAVDIARAASVEAFAAQLVEQCGAVDVLVNNAGVAVVAPFARIGEADLEWLVGVNVWGPLRLTRALLPAMIARDGGHVVVVASFAGLVGAPGMVAYSTTKFAMVGFCEALRLELAETGIGVTVVCPGYVRTNLSRATRYDNPVFRSRLDHAPSWYGMTKEKVACELADAVTARRPLVVLGPEKVGWWLKRLAPEAAFAVTRWIARRTGIGGTQEAPCTLP